MKWKANNDYTLALIYQTGKADTVLGMLKTLKQIRELKEIGK